MKTLKLTEENFWSEFPRLVELVFSPLKISHRISEQEIQKTERRLGLILPPTLREFYHRAGKHPELTNDYDHLISLEKLKIVDKKYLVFFEENQGAYDQAFDISKKLSNPPVVWHFGDRKWDKHSDTMTQFLGSALLVQVTRGGSFKYAYGDGEVAKKELDSFIRSFAVRENWNVLDLGEYIGMIKKGTGIYFFIPSKPEEKGYVWGATQNKKEAQRLKKTFSMDFAVEDDE